MKQTEQQVVKDDKLLIDAMNNLVKITNELSMIILTRSELTEKDYQDINSSLKKIVDQYKDGLPKKPEFPPPREIKEDFI